MCSLVYSIFLLICDFYIVLAIIHLCAYEFACGASKYEYLERRWHIPDLIQRSKINAHCSSLPRAYDYPSHTRFLSLSLFAYPLPY